jgi:alcohol dehydrogenase
MQAMVYRGPYKIRVEEKDIPRIEHPNDAIVRVTIELRPKTCATRVTG